MVNKVPIRCSSCNKETTNPKFCSRSCAAKLNNKLAPKRKSLRQCIICNELTGDYQKARCPTHHKEYLATRYEVYQHRTIGEYFARDCLKKFHPSCRAVHIRALARTRFKHLMKIPCAGCGYSYHVELCHLKPISTFPETATIAEVNSPDNILQLCRNCHWELDHAIITIDQIRNTPYPNCTDISRIKSPV